MNEPLRLALPRAFPNVDLDAVVGLHTGLASISQLRGSSAHDSATPDEQKARDVGELWDLVAGSSGGGFLAKFHSAFGLSGDNLGSGHAGGR